MTRALIGWLAFVIGALCIAAPATVAHTSNGVSILGILLLLLWGHLVFGIFSRHFWVPDEAENEHCNETDRALDKEAAR